jgi:hypothetical protein
MSNLQSMISEEQMKTFYLYRSDQSFLGTLSAADYDAATMLANVVFGPDVLTLTELICKS